MGGLENRIKTFTSLIQEKQKILFGFIRHLLINFLIFHRNWYFSNKKLWIWLVYWQTKQGIHQIWCTDSHLHGNKISETPKSHLLLIIVYTILNWSYFTEVGKNLYCFFNLGFGSYYLPTSTFWLFGALLCHLVSMLTNI